VAFRHELCDTHGTYKGTFVTDTERWQIGDAFTDGDGRALRITDIAAPEHSNQRPTYTDRWIVEPIQAATSQRDTSNSATIAAGTGAAGSSDVARRAVTKARAIRQPPPAHPA
jgi:hypothetical protein